MKPIVYLAHPVTGDPVGNAHRTIDWVKWLTLNNPEAIFVAPWVAEVLAFADDDVSPEFYDRVLADDLAVVERCDGMLLVGGCLSRGMKLEADKAADEGLPVVDWTCYATPQDVPPGEVPW